MLQLFLGIDAVSQGLVDVRWSLLPKEDGPHRQERHRHKALSYTCRWRMAKQHGKIT